MGGCPARSSTSRARSRGPRHDDRPIFDGLIGRAQRRAVGDPAAGVRAEVHRPRAVHGAGRARLLREGARLLEGYDDEVGLDWQQAADGCSVNAPRGTRGAGEAEAPGANPTDRGKCGVKRHLLTEGTGVPIAVVLPGPIAPTSAGRAARCDGGRGVAAEPAGAAPGTRALCLEATTTTPAARRRPSGAIGRLSHPHAARTTRRRPGLPTGTRRGAGWWRWRIAGSTASAAS